MTQDNLIARLQKVAESTQTLSGIHAIQEAIERLSPPPKAKPRRKKEGPCGCDVDPFGCERHPS